LKDKVPETIIEALNKLKNKKFPGRDGDDVLETVVGLPAKLFYNTGIPASILIIPQGAGIVG
jgi:hypothetical protein